MGNVLRDFRRMIYTLRRKYAFDFDLYRVTETINFETGKKVTLRTKYPILKGILLPSIVYRDYNYSNQVPGSNQFGGVVDTTTRRIIIDKRGLPDNFNLTVNDYFVFNHQRYAIKEITEMEIVDYLNIVAKQVIKEPPFQAYDFSIVDYIGLTESLNGEQIVDITKILIEEKPVIIDPYNPFLIYTNLEEL